MSTFLTDLVERHHPDPREDGLVADVLAMGAAAVEPLTAALQSETALERVLAAQLLACLNDPRAVPALIEALCGDNLWEDRIAKRRGRLLFLLINVCDRAGQARLSGLRAQNKALIRRHCAFALGKIGDARAAGALRDLLTDPDENVRQAARNALTALNRNTPPPV